MRVYVAGPYTTGDVGINIRQAVIAADMLASAGHFAFVPHTMFHAWHVLAPRTYDEWMAHCFEWLRVCHALVRLPGPSKGADAEVAEAHRLGIPVYTIDTLLIDPDPGG